MAQSALFYTIASRSSSSSHSSLWYVVQIIIAIIIIIITNYRDTVLMAQPSFTPLQHGHLLHRAHNFCHHDNRQWFTFSPLLHHYCVAITFSIFFIISRSHQNQHHLLNHHHHLQASSFSIFFNISKSHHGGGGFFASFEGHQGARCWVREERKSGQEEMKQIERVQMEMERCYLVVVLC